MTYSARQRWKAAGITALVIVAAILLGTLILAVAAGVGLVACAIAGKPLTLDWAMAADLVIVVPGTFMGWLVGGAIRNLYRDILEVISGRPR